jgi:hypothetical protein
VQALLRTAPDAATAAAALASLRGDCWHAGSLQAALSQLPALQEACGAESVRRALADAAPASGGTQCFILRIALAALCEEATDGRGWAAERREALRSLEAVARGACAEGDAAGLTEALAWAMADEEGG